MRRRAASVPRLPVGVVALLVALPLAARAQTVPSTGADAGTGTSPASLLRGEAGSRLVDATRLLELRRWGVRGGYAAASAVDVREWRLEAALRRGPAALAASTTAREVRDLFDDPALASSGLRVGDVLHEMALAVDAPRAHLAVGVVASMRRSTVLGAVGRARTLDASAVARLRHGAELRVGSRVVTAPLRWSGGAGETNPEERSAAIALEAPLWRRTAGLAVSAGIEHAQLLGGPSRGERADGGRLALAGLGPLGVAAGITQHAGPRMPTRWSVQVGLSARVRDVSAAITNRFDDGPLGDARALAAALER